MEKENKYEEVLLFSSLNYYQINEVCAILTENNIPFIRKDDGTGSYMNLYMGHSYQEKSVFVSKKDYDKAIELISVITTNNEDETFEDEQQDEKDRTSNTLTLISKIAISTVLIIPILIIILGIILTIVQKN